MTDLRFVFVCFCLFVIAVVALVQAYNYGITPIPEEQMLENLGFDYTYDKTVLDDLKGNNLDTLRAYISSQSQVPAPVPLSRGAVRTCASSCTCLGCDDVTIAGCFPLCIGWAARCAVV